MTLGPLEFSLPGTSQIGIALLNFNPPKETEFCTGFREHQCIRKWERNCLSPTFLLSDLLFATYSPCGVVGNYIYQTPLLLGWDERRRKVRIFLPFSPCLLKYLWLWLCLLHGSAAPDSPSSTLSVILSHGFSSYWEVWLLSCMAPSFPIVFPTLK